MKNIYFSIHGIVNQKKSKGIISLTTAWMDHTCSEMSVKALFVGNVQQRAHSVKHVHMTSCKKKKKKLL